MRLCCKYTKSSLHFQIKAEKTIFMPAKHTKHAMEKGRFFQEVLVKV